MNTIELTKNQNQALEPAEPSSGIQHGTVPVEFADPAEPEQRQDLWLTDLIRQAKQVRALAERIQHEVRQRPERWPEPYLLD